MRVELEEIAEALRERAGFGPDDTPLAAEVAIELLGEDGLVFGADEAGFRLSREGVIFVPPNAPEKNWGIAHELGELGLRLVGYTGIGMAKEAAANYIAAAVLAPRHQVVAAYRHYGERLRTLSRAFGMSQTAVVLRLGEVLEDERAVVTRTGHVLTRSQGAFPWADVPVIEVARGVAHWRGLAKTRLVGGIDEGRVALRARG